MVESALETLPRRTWTPPLRGFGETLCLVLGDVIWILVVLIRIGLVWGIFYSSKYLLVRSDITAQGIWSSHGCLILAITLVPDLLFIWGIGHLVWCTVRSKFSLPLDLCPPYSLVCCLETVSKSRVSTLVCVKSLGSWICALSLV